MSAQDKIEIDTVKQNFDWAHVGSNVNCTGQHQKCSENVKFLTTVISRYDIKYTLIKISLI